MRVEAIPSGKLIIHEDARLLVDAGPGLPWGIGPLIGVVFTGGAPEQIGGLYNLLHLQRGRALTLVHPVVDERVAVLVEAWQRNEGQDPQLTLESDWGGGCQVGPFRLHALPGGWRVRAGGEVVDV